MKTLQVGYAFYPDPVGGTEVYIQNLALALQKKGIASVIVAARSDGSSSRYSHVGLPVRRFDIGDQAGASKTFLNELYGEGDPVAAEAFGQIIDEEQPDVVHLHAFTRACSVRLVRAAKQRGVKVVFTYHTPTVSCQRGTLLLEGRQVCDGVLEIDRCTRCTLQGVGVPLLLNSALAGVPDAMSGWLADRGLAGGIWTALRMRQLVGIRQQALKDMLAEVDAVVVVCDWARTLLMANGLRAEKISLSRHGLAVLPQVPQGLPMGGAQPDCLRIAYLGRIHPSKGVETLVEAVHRQPHLNVRLDLYGVVQDRVGNDLRERLMTLARYDSRIVFKPPLASAEVVTALQHYDVLAVPSQILETGPLVVLEAFAAGIPVIGSNLGGIAELIQHDVNGLLVVPGSVTAWVQAIAQCSEDRALLTRLRSGVRQPRQIETVANEMRALYQQSLDMA